MKPWRESATLIIVSKQLSRNSDNQNLYKTLLLKRVKTARRLPETYVFPGGVTSNSDFSPKWWHVFEKQGFTKDSLISSISKRFSGPRPPIINNSLTLSRLGNPENSLPADIALRITALRETFEETGKSKDLL